LGLFCKNLKPRFLKPISTAVKQMPPKPLPENMWTPTFIYALLLPRRLASGKNCGAAFRIGNPSTDENSVGATAAASRRRRCTLYAAVRRRRRPVPGWSLLNASVRRRPLQPCQGQLRLLRRRSTTRPSFPHHRRWDGLQDGSLSDQHVGTRWWFRFISGFATCWQSKQKMTLCVTLYHPM